MSKDLHQRLRDVVKTVHSTGKWPINTLSLLNEAATALSNVCPAGNSDEELVAATPGYDAEVDAKMGVELLPPIRVNATTAGLLRRFADLEGVILQSFVRRILDERMCASADPGGDGATPAEQVCTQAEAARQIRNGAHTAAPSEVFWDKMNKALPSEAAAAQQTKGGEHA